MELVQGLYLEPRQVECVSEQRVVLGTAADLFLDDRGGPARTTAEQLAENVQPFDQGEVRQAHGVEDQRLVAPHGATSSSGTTGRSLSTT
ncbi:hypothetical protein [Lentzea sp. E54]|uniref:hypothetical protein n=1 Tax=Lentzea xerophila TaxID=3435883 RepID=UPI003DA4199F